MRTTSYSHGRSNSPQRGDLNVVAQEEIARPRSEDVGTRAHEAADPHGPDALTARMTRTRNASA